MNFHFRKGEEQEVLIEDLYTKGDKHEVHNEQKIKKYSAAIREVFMVYLLKGPPASGKSTYAKRFIKNNPKFVRINGDDLKLVYPNLPYSDIYAIMFRTAKIALSFGGSVIVDNTNVNPGTVQAWKNLAKEYNVEYIEKTFFDVDFNTCVLRNSLRENPVPFTVIWKMFVDFGLPVPFVGSCFIFDIDGTLADASHRLHYLKETPKNWKGFFSEVSKDPAIDSVAKVLGMIKIFYPVIFVSGRAEGCREDTEKWINAILKVRDYHLFMRGFNDKREDSIVKKELYEKYIQPYAHVQGVFDDRNSVVKMWRSLGLTCFQVAEGDF